MKGPDGMYTIDGKKFTFLEGSRQQVGHGTAYRTSGDLTQKDLIKNIRGRWVSKKKSTTAKKEKRLECHGIFTQKGKMVLGGIRRTPLKSSKCNKFPNRPKTKTLRKKV